MRPEIKDLTEISQFFGRNNEYVIAGGGNTSFKDEKSIWIKASGYPLADLDEKGLVSLSRDKLQLISVKSYSEDPVKREEEIKNDLFKSIIDQGETRRPSVETSLHELINYKFVVHLHPTLINGILCGRNAKSLTHKLLGDNIMFVEYTDPGYTLFKKLESEILKYRETYSTDPQIILLENHGSFVSADTIEEIRAIYEQIISASKTYLTYLPEPVELPYNPVLHKVMPAVRMMLSDKQMKVTRYRHNELIAKYYQTQQEFHKISLPLTPDTIVYCKARFMFIEQHATAEKILDSITQQLPRFQDEYQYQPFVIIIKSCGLLAISNSVSSAETILDVFEDHIKVCYYSSLCGGTKYLTPDQVSFIDRWEVENYRRQISQDLKDRNRLNNKIAIVTGGAQGFGAGIAEELFKLSVNVVIADLNEEAGEKAVADLNSKGSSNRAFFVKCDVSDAGSVKILIELCVKELGGLDIMVSNAGILKAGGLEEMDPAVFAKTTDINYNGYFLCAKYASEVMKIQNAEKPDYFSDIIQINSKSGLRGSNRNFAYAGAKFGGIGLTQSFALELAPYKIKVNSICPGNFYEGPLWSDPKKGLFVQYLNTGKVPGAKSIDDVRKFYEEQVPLKRGCRINDIVKALLYIIDQEYETGQAVPVTGGQVMLG
jgi:NAD(P)-dependent dehydrogenase (short-subunit alcohol dehydrogenase family)/rhamnose utilization protein RhaD (predicted bifunctional aldolase and dehydrogenase)